MGLQTSCARGHTVSAMASNGWCESVVEKSSKDALAWIDLRTMSVHVNLRRATPLSGYYCCQIRRSGGTCSGAART